jgi:predicted dehydrogenase
LSIIGEQPITVNCRGSAHITPGIEDVTTMCLGFAKQQSAIIHSSWLDPRKVREMTIVGSKRMVVYDDVAPLEKIRVFDARVESPPHYDTFAEFQYAYHYGDMYVPYIKQEEPLKTECQHFLDCIKNGTTPLTDGRQGLELVRILEASTKSLEKGGAPVELVSVRADLSRTESRGATARRPEVRILAQGMEDQKRPAPDGRKLRVRLRMNGH